MSKNNPLDSVPTEVVERVKHLRQVIDRYRYDYHVKDQSDFGEAAADDLKHELSELENKYPSLRNADSPTARVAGEVKKGFTKVQHKVPMISLNDVFNFEELAAWAKRAETFLNGEAVDFFGDIKMDGLACALIYENGQLVQAVTRGDSLVGEDVTANAMQIKNIPHILKTGGIEPGSRVEIRGEIVVLKDDFDKINAEQKRLKQPLFANPRNLAAGTMRQLDSSIVAERPLNFFGYDLILETDQPLTFEAKYDIMERWGIETSGNHFTAQTIQQVENQINQLDQKRAGLPFNTDGVVIKVDNADQYVRLGTVGKAPRGATAYKYPAETAAAVVKDIVLSLGRTGVAVPVATFKAVRLAGTTVKHASLHNADEIKRLDVRVGDTVVVYKAGEIIPQIERVLLELRPKNSQAFDYEEALREQFPDMKFEKLEGEVAWRAKNLNQGTFLKRSLEFFASRSCMDITGLGEKNVEALVDSGLVKDLADIYYLTANDLLELDRFAKLSANNLINAIQDKKTVDAGRFLGSLGIRNIGQKTARDLMKHFQTFESLTSASEDDLMSVNGVGKVVAENLIGWLVDRDNQELLQKFWRAGVKLTNEQVAGKLQGQSFVITGTLEAMGRDEAARKIEEQGGEFQTGVSRSTTYLVVGQEAGQGKIEKAQALGTSIIDEPTFLAML